jgi:hypothetical protein
MGMLVDGLMDGWIDDKKSLRTEFVSLHESISDYSGI